MQTIILCGGLGTRLREETLKGGRLKRVEKYIHGDTFMLTYGDGVADVDIQKLIDFHHLHEELSKHEKTSHRHSDF